MTNEEFLRIARKVRASTVRVTEENLAKVVGAEDHALILRAREAGAAKPATATTAPPAPLTGDDQ